MRKTFGLLILLTALTDPAYAMKRERKKGAVRTRPYLARACKLVKVQPVVVIAEPENPEQEHDDNEIVVIMPAIEVLEQAFIDHDLVDLVIDTDIPDNLCNEKVPCLIALQIVGWRKKDVELQDKIYAAVCDVLADQPEARAEIHRFIIGLRNDTTELEELSEEL